MTKDVILLTYKTKSLAQLHTIKNDKSKIATKSVWLDANLTDVKEFSDFVNSHSDKAIFSTTFMTKEQLREYRIHNLETTGVDNTPEVTLIQLKGIFNRNQQFNRFLIVDSRTTDYIKRRVLHAKVNQESNEQE